MGPHFLLPPQLLFFKTFLFLSILFPAYFAIEDEQFSACEPFSCGNITNLSYPFWGNSQHDYCGHPKFKLDCQGDNVTINITSQNFRVIGVNSTTRTLTIERMDLWGTTCPEEFTNISLDYAFFNYTLNDENSTLLFDCDLSEYTGSLNLSSSVRFDCPIDGVSREAYFLLSEKWGNLSTLGCRTSITVPLLGLAVKSFIMDTLDPGYVIDQGFEVKWELNEESSCDDCRFSGGRCGYNVSLNEFRCFCPNQTYDGICGIDPLWAPTPAPLPPRPYPQQSMCSSSLLPI